LLKNSTNNILAYFIVYVNVITKNKLILDYLMYMLVVCLPGNWDKIGTFL